MPAGWDASSDTLLLRLKLVTGEWGYWDYCYLADVVVNGAHSLTLPDPDDDIVELYHSDFLDASDVDDWAYSGAYNAGPMPEHVNNALVLRGDGAAVLSIAHSLTAFDSARITATLAGYGLDADDPRLASY